jgi:superfamily II DNA or RNA helicase
MIELEKIDESFLKIHCEKDVAKELSSFFTFKVPNHQFSPAFRKKIWDGKIRLFNTASHTIYYGLLDYVEQFLIERKYQYKKINISNDVLDEESIKQWILNQKIYSNKKEITPHDYQINGVIKAIKSNRILLLSPTGSGKSLIIYLCIKYLLEHYSDKKFLIVVPTTGLVNQLLNDFIDYSNKDIKFVRQIHTIFAGKEKESNKRITISTWQSIFRESENYFSQFYGVFGDECHLFKAKSLSSLIRKMKSCRFRIGTTGTLDNIQAHKLIIEGLFGRVYSITTTKNLIDDKILSNLSIKNILLSYDSTSINQIKKAKYVDEMSWLIANDKRNNFIADLATSLKGNVLVLFNFVERHGIPLHDKIKNKSKKDTFMIHGKTDVEQRELIRNIVNKHDNSVLVASYGTCSTGINIKNIHAIIFASPSKSVVRVLQSIGRGLRKSESKDKVTVYDIGDDLQYKSYRNHTLKHMDERLAIYNKEKFNYKVLKIRLGES